MRELRYPPAERLDVTENLHGHEVGDPYRWLEDNGSTATKAWAAAQDALYAEASEHYTARDRFADRIRSLLGAGAVGAPVWRGDRSFFVRRTAEQEHAVLYVRDGDGPERVLVDPGALDPGGLTTLDAWKPGPDGRLLAYQLSEGGDEESVLRVVDVDSGDLVDGPVDRARYSPIAWLPDSSAFYYVRRLPPEEVPDGEEAYHRRVYLHRLGRPAEEDVLVFGSGRDKTEYYSPSVSRDGRWLILQAVRGTSSATDMWIADLSDGDLERPRLVPVQEGVDADLEGHVGRDGRLYLRTDRDAPRGRVCVTDPADPGYENWTTLVPEEPEAVLEDYAVLDGPALERPELLVSHSRHAISEVTQRDLLTGELLGVVDMPGLGTVGGLSERPEGGHEAWFGYTDNTHPSSVYRYDALAGRVSVWADAPGDIDLPDVNVEQVTYTSGDGTPVRMLVVSPSAPAEGPRPTILYGYGGFRISLTPAYSAVALAWARAGGVYAVANLRGGLEEGEEWHRSGMLARKQNVFDDCAAAAEHLIATGVTAPDRLAVMGGSNGGLLVGAMVTQRPDLFAAAVCSAPLLDMVRYERFGLGQLWNVEYGTADDPEQLGWLLGYSPYHNVREGTRYPATLFTVFDNDTRVDPLHARKLCAAMQDATSAPAEERPVLLRREAEVGHSSRSVSRSVSLNSEQLAFLAHHLGLAAG
ncbi:prolyl oligopeptidase family serine peptidase [Nocardiopsis tropica]|uniref:prolyl oligopeptidase n=1 Tax=Nocardiopsis tropica TaxID=109330 RepID=A0ABU7KXZ5_9ACTN|nr:prolyl oligopeptidase family serine peptidase [Nocardiopsis umidischolae]MEE2054188.1 prolyl oligopeptidase family serine peptidase [Nocardiopsis umidischolae]